MVARGIVSVVVGLVAGYMVLYMGVAVNSLTAAYTLPAVVQGFEIAQTMTTNSNAANVIYNIQNQTINAYSNITRTSLTAFNIAGSLLIIVGIIALLLIALRFVTDNLLGAFNSA